MTHEVESKFQVTSSEVFHQIRSQKQVAGYRLANQGKFLQRDTYVDTSTRLLLRQGAYLRLRERDGTFLATFKNKIDGNYVRRELEISLTASQAQDLLNALLKRYLFSDDDDIPSLPHTFNNMAKRRRYFIRIQGRLSLSKFG